MEQRMIREMLEVDSPYRGLVYVVCLIFMILV